MPRKRPENPLEAEALALAQKGIEAGVDDRHDDAVRHWRAASAFADARLPGADIDYWIKSGLGAALHDAGLHEEGIDISQIALDWCAARKQPLPALTIARCYRRLGDAAAAEAYLDQARALAGDEIPDAWQD